MSHKLSQPARRAQSKIMHAAKKGDPAAVAAARAEFKALKLEDYIRQLVDSAPRLSDEQRDRLALLLRPTA